MNKTNKAKVLSLPRTETFTDAAGRPAIRYLDDDVALGIAAGSELLAAPDNPCCDRHGAARFSALQTA